MIIKLHWRTFFPLLAVNLHTDDMFTPQQNPERRRQTIVHTETLQHSEIVVYLGCRKQFKKKKSNRFLPRSNYMKVTADTAAKTAMCLDCVWFWGLLDSLTFFHLINQDNYSSFVVHACILTRLICSHAGVSNFTQYTVINHHF